MQTTKCVFTLQQLGMKEGKNTAAQILTKTKEFDHITPIPACLYWFPVRTDFKVLRLTHKGLQGLVPPYLPELITPYTPICPFHTGFLVIPPVNTKSAGHKGFIYHAPCL